MEKLEKLFTGHSNKGKGLAGLVLKGVRAFVTSLLVLEVAIILVADNERIKGKKHLGPTPTHP